DGSTWLPPVRGGAWAEGRTSNWRRNQGRAASNCNSLATTLDAKQQAQVQSTTPPASRPPSRRAVEAPAMPANRAFPLLALLLGAALVPAAAPPRGPIAGWVEDLASDDTARWRQAVDQLWKAGRAAEPALRAAMKHRDADVVLRARLVLARFEWGI